jgi:transcriptional regulator with XRE-family HTH domain
MISHWEREVKNPSIELVQKLADALGVSVKHFYQQKNIPQDENVSRALYKRLELVKELPPKAQKSVQEYIDMVAKVKQA